LIYALTAKQKIIIEAQIISGAVLSVSITANVFGLGEEADLTAQRYQICTTLN